MNCQQCAQPAVVRYPSGFALCLDCHLKYQQNQQRNLERLKRERHRSANDTDDTWRRPRRDGGFPERKQATATRTVNTIRIDRVNVGIVSTRSIQSMLASVADIQQGGDLALSAALIEMTEAVIDSPELQPDQKKDAVEMLGALAAEGALSKLQRRSVAMRAVLTGFAETVNGEARLTTLWVRLGPIITAAF